MNATTQDIFACFRLLLGREPNPEELAGHLGMAGTPLPAVVTSYLQSLEFKNRNLLRDESRVDLAKVHGFSIYLAADDYLISPGVREGCYEPEVTTAFLEHLKPESCVLDVGANCGYYSLLASSRGATVYAFEPLQRNLKLLSASKAINGFRNLHIVAAAASDVTGGTLSIGASYTNGMVGPHPDAPDACLTADYVAAVRIDDCIPADTFVSLVKVDVEGHEHLALMGAEQTLRRCRPVVIFEFNNQSWPGVYALLTDLAYRISSIGENDRIAIPMHAEA